MQNFWFNLQLVLCRVGIVCLTLYYKYRYPKQKEHKS